MDDERIGGKERNTVRETDGSEDVIRWLKKE